LNTLSPSREFEYFKPKSPDEAISLLGKYGDKAKVLAGGTDLLIDIKLRRIKSDYLIDITGIAELKGITSDERGLRIGATTLQSEIVGSQLIQDKYVTLFEAVGKMGTTQIRNIATIGGNLCTASAGADTAPPLLVLEAEIEIASKSGRRTVPLEEFFTGPGQTVLKAGELLTAILIPATSPHTGTSFIRISRTASDLPQLNAAVALKTDNSMCKEVKIALGAVAPTPIRARKAEAILKNRELNQDAIEEAANMVVGDINPRTSIRSTSEYRKDVAIVITKRALLKAWERSKKS